MSVNLRWACGPFPMTSHYDTSESSEGDISKGEMQDAILRSGYLIELRVRQKMEESGFHVESSPAYADPLTGKSREYDLSAVTTFDLLGRDQTIDFLWAHLVVECENNIQPIVFFTPKSDFDHLISEAVKISGMPLKFPSENWAKNLPELLEFEKFHHYWRWPVATQYCSFHRKNPKSPWIASHPEAHHQTFTSLINALESEMDEHFRLLAENKPGERQSVNLSINYPLLILAGDILLATQTAKGISLRQVSKVQLRKELWHTGRRSVYHIDVITESHLGKYLDQIHNEIKSIRKLGQDKSAVIVEALTMCVAKVRSSPEQLRQVIEAI